ncbi:protein of unknown function [Paenibacillus alvei]|uniref:Uncharacterized protein n=1 Tax=Paenibacillus alvei TaxID=44250 RepID=A0A383RGK7_PAEAL|nr:protein of unknown function [Paenibacillus alvei]
MFILTRVTQLDNHSILDMRYYDSGVEK